MKLVQRDNYLFTALIVLLVLALYVNLSKVLFGSRYFTLIADGFTFLLALRILLAKLLLARKFPPLELFTLLFMFLGAVYIFHPNVPTLLAGVEGYRRLMFQMLGLFIGLTAVRSREDMILLGKVIGIAAIPALLWGIKQFFYMSDMDYALMGTNQAGVYSWKIFGKTRAFSFFNGPFHLGLLAGFCFWLGIGMYVEFKSRWWLWLSVGGFLACLASLTRSSLIAVISSFPIVLFFAFRKYRVRVVVFSLAVLVGLTGLLALLRGYVDEVDLLLESVSTIDEISTDSRLETRFGGYEKALTEVAEHPLGLGTGSSGDAMAYYFEPYNKIHLTSHNLLLRVLIEDGLVGFVLFCIILFLIFRAVWNLRRQGETSLFLIGLGLLGIIMITGLTGSTLGAYPMNLIFWTCMGGLIACSRRDSEKDNDVRAN